MDPAPAPRYCGGCGAPLDPPGGECAACAAPAKAAPDHRSEARGLASSLVLYAALLATSLAGIVAGGIVGDDADAATYIEIEKWLIALDSLLVLGWCLAARRTIGDGLRRVPGARWFLFGALAPIATFSLASLAMWGVTSLLDVPELTYSDSYLSAGYGWGFVVLMVCVQPALIEELAFRGVILGNMRQVMGVREAVVVSSLMFMMLHLAPLAFAHLLVIGLVLGFLRVKSGSLYPGILAHFLHNGLVLLDEYLHS